MGGCVPLAQPPHGRLTWCTAAPGGRSPGKVEGWRRECGESPIADAFYPCSLPNSVCRLQAGGTIFSGAGMMV